MPIDPVQISLAIKHDFRRYLTTTLGVSAKYSDLREQFMEALVNDNTLFRGPYLQGTPPYRTGESLSGLVKQKLLPDIINKVPFLGDYEQALYWHQVETIRKVRQGRNVILASGTGSGKTLSFLVPIVSKILENPQPGVHALLLYPMNALVNDQLKTLRRILKDVPEVTFGRYVNKNITPETEKEARRLQPKALKHEVVSREEFRRQPPNILITNYAMLEYLLLRTKDSPLFNGPWRNVVLDELHTYSGAKGSEVALLFRRLHNRVKSNSDQKRIQFIATSASLGASDPDTQEEVASFAAKLFDAEFKPTDLVEAKFLKKQSVGKADLEVSSAIYTDELFDKALESKSWLDGLSKVLDECNFPLKVIAEAENLGAIDFETALYHLFARDKRIALLREAVKGIPDLAGAALKVFGSREDAAVQALISLVRICSLAKVPGGDARLVPCRYHFFVKGVTGGYLAFDRMSSDKSWQPTLMLEPAKTGPDKQTKTLVLNLCRKCGQPYVKGYRVVRDGGKEYLEGIRSNLEDKYRQTWFVWDEPQLASIDEEDEEQEESERNFPKFQYCAKCGRLGTVELICDCKKDPHILTLWEIPLNKQQEATKCIACRGSGTITEFKADSEAAQTAVADSFYKQLPESANKKARSYPGKGRKLLVFSDSRQSAAYFAPYLENTHTEQKFRWLIYQALLRAKDNGASGVNADTLINFMLNINEEKAIFPYERDEDWMRNECAVAIVREFCLPTSRRQSLEALALVKVEVDFGRFFEYPEELNSRWGLTEEEIRHLIQVLLSSIRLQKALELPTPLTHADVRFKPFNKNTVIIDRYSQVGPQFALQGFLPTAAPARQRRGSYVKKVLETAARRSGLQLPKDQDVLESMLLIWRALAETEGPASSFRQIQVGEGKVGRQIRWRNLRFTLTDHWWYCPKCNQWSVYNVGGVCPSFTCQGTLRREDPIEHFRFHHYRQLYSDSIMVPLVAKEHTAQLSPEVATRYQDAFQEGHSPEGQINILSCSTTFELGVDLGDLEAVYLRDVPPTPTNYQQRSGRAGRGVGTAAFVVTFALSRSHDANYFSAPEEIIAGRTPPPRITLDNEIIIKRHINSVLLSEFFRMKMENPYGIGGFFEGDGLPPLYHEFTAQVPGMVKDLKDDLNKLVPSTYSLEHIPTDVCQDFSEARDYYFGELDIYTDAITQAVKLRDEAEKAGKPSKIHGYINFLYSRMADFRKTDWISFFSDRNVLPGYAFPIYNVALDTPDKGIRLERDLRIALSEYAPGASVVAAGKLWQSVGIKLPPNRTLEQKHYVRCAKCWHVQRHLKKEELFETCPVCGHDGTRPLSPKNFYVVPKYGFTTDMQVDGKAITFDRPHPVYASKVLFVPQQDSDGPADLLVGDEGHTGIALRGTEKADFFVFNDGDDGSHRGFNLCESCGRKSESKPSAKQKDEPHKTPDGRPCRGRFKLKHLGHEFHGSATRLQFFGSGRQYTEHSFWLSLMYALLGGMSDALGIEKADIDGVIRSVSLDGYPTQEIVLYDSVPGGAGYVKRLLTERDLLKVLKAAYRRVADCQCGDDASCYRCLREYRNQFYHDVLARGPVVAYLDKLLRDLDSEVTADKPYALADAPRLLSRLLRESTQMDLVGVELTDMGPAEIGPWYVALQTFANKNPTGLRLALYDLPTATPERIADVLPLIALLTAGAKLYKVKTGADKPPYALLAAKSDGHQTALKWAEDVVVPLDGECHRKPMLVNMNDAYLEQVKIKTDNWFVKHTSPLQTKDILVPGFKIFRIEAGRPVDYGQVFAGISSTPGYRQIIVQEPYLLNEHQLKCFDKFLAVIDKVARGSEVEFTLRTKEPHPRDAMAFSKQVQKDKIYSLIKKYPWVELALVVKPYTDKGIHQRYAYVVWKDGRDLLLNLDRGFDLEDARGMAWGSPVVQYSPVGTDWRQVIFGK